MSRKQYDEDFKKTIVELYNNGKSASEITREYGISNSVIYRWIKDYSPIEAGDGTTTSNKEILDLKKELSKTKGKLEILKKAIAIFTRK